MKLGRPPKHAFNSLKVGEKAKLTGKARKFPHQFIYQYNLSESGRLIKVSREGKKVFAERIK